MAYDREFFLEILNHICEHAVGCNGEHGCEDCLGFIDGGAGDDHTPCAYSKRYFQALSFTFAFSNIGIPYTPPPSPKALPKFYRGKQFQKTEEAKCR